MSLPHAFLSFLSIWPWFKKLTSDMLSFTSLSTTWSFYSEAPSSYMRAHYVPFWTLSCQMGKTYLSLPHISKDHYHTMKPIHLITNIFHLRKVKENYQDWVTGFVVVFSKQNSQEQSLFIVLVTDNTCKCCCFFLGGGHGFIRIGNFPSVCQTWNRYDGTMLVTRDGRCMDKKSRTT